jgi:hypothetical protein
MHRPDAGRLPVLYGDHTMHRTTITPHQALAASFAAALYIKPGEAQPAATKRLMAQRKRAWVTPDARSFPRWVPGMSVAEYVQAFYSANQIGKPSHLHLTDTPQELLDDAVQVQYIDAEEIDAGACFNAARLSMANHVAQLAA